MKILITPFGNLHGPRLLGLTRTGSKFGDFWVNAVKAMSTFPRVAVRAGPIR